MKTITVTDDEVVKAAAMAVKLCIAETPTRALIREELCNVTACMTAILFKDAKESEG